MPPAPAPSSAATWDLFCRVVDNFGDVGVCWRLARELGARGVRVRLWIDDASALAWMAPRRADGVSVLPWPAAALAEPGDVVIEAFGCDPDPAFVERMAQRTAAPVWINLEYLSAEDYVERSHGLPSPQQAGPGRGLTKWFFYPGFTSRTGGLIVERGLAARQHGFDAAAWLATWQVRRRDGELLLTLFAYPSAPWPMLMAALASRPSCWLLPPGPLQAAVLAADKPASMRCVALPWLNQDDFDHLLWSADLNAVRGEDSLVRALWAGHPLLWQLYPQHDGAQRAKLAAFTRWFGADASLAAAWRAWNGDGTLELPNELGPWHRATAAARARLLAQTDRAEEPACDLVSALQRFVTSVQTLPG